MQICWGEAQFPSKVTGSGRIYIFKDSREMPDTFHLVAEYAKGHSLVLSSSMGNAQHIPGLIRGHAGTIVMVEHGIFERPTPFITIKPELARDRQAPRNAPLKPVGGEAYVSKFGIKDVQIAVDQTDMMVEHVKNFLHCMHSAKSRTWTWRPAPEQWWSSTWRPFFPEEQNPVLGREELEGFGKAHPSIKAVDALPYAAGAGGQHFKRRRGMDRSVWRNPVKTRLAEGQPVVGVTITGDNVEVAAQLASFGFDFLWIEMDDFGILNWPSSAV
jgi:hypothetical protein